MFIINKLFRSIHNRLKYAVCCNAHSCLRFHKSSVMHSLTSAPASTVLPSDFTETTRQVLSSTTTIIRLLLRKYTPIECDLALGTFRDYSTWNYFLFVEFFFCVFANGMLYNALPKAHLFLQRAERFYSAAFSSLYQSIITKWHHAVVIED